MKTFIVVFKTKKLQEFKSTDFATFYFENDEIDFDNEVSSITILDF